MKATIISKHLGAKALGVYGLVCCSSIFLLVGSGLSLENALIYTVSGITSTCFTNLQAVSWSFSQQLVYSLLMFFGLVWSCSAGWYCLNIVKGSKLTPRQIVNQTAIFFSLVAIAGTAILFMLWDFTQPFFDNNALKLWYSFFHCISFISANGITLYTGATSHPLIAQAFILQIALRCLSLIGFIGAMACLEVVSLSKMRARMRDTSLNYPKPVLVIILLSTCLLIVASCVGTMASSSAIYGFIAGIDMLVLGKSSNVLVIIALGAVSMMGGTGGGFKVPYLVKYNLLVLGIIAAIIVLEYTIKVADCSFLGCYINGSAKILMLNDFGFLQLLIAILGHNMLIVSGLCVRVKVWLKHNA